MVVLFTPSVNDEASTKKGQTKASSAFQLRIYNDLNKNLSVSENFLWVHSL